MKQEDKKKRKDMKMKRDLIFSLSSTASVV
jgi:hypothetical protein